MVYEFLKKQQEELIAKKIELDEDYELVLSKIKENEKFLDLLDEEDSSYFSDFTPRDINQKNKSRIQELQQLLVGLNQDKIKLSAEIDRVHEKLSDCEKALEEVKDTKNSQEQLKDVSHEKKLKTISSYIISDPRRAKLELDHYISKYMS